MNAISFIIMIAVLGWNIYGIFQVGIENTSMIQWGLTGLMAVFVVRGGMQRMKE